jgi:predicted DNA-binding ribbon-helix-helix protein
MTRQTNPTSVIRMNMDINDRRTSFALEAGIWDALTVMSRDKEQSIDETCEAIVSRASDGVSMASAIRLAVLEHFIEPHRA